MKNIFLASASPRRLELLQQIGLNPQVILPQFEEEMSNFKNPEQLAVQNAEGKACAASKIISNKNSIIIAADTIVIFQHQILGKPKDKQEASQMLSLLSGTEHEVCTGFCVWDCTSERFMSSFTKTTVAMRKISDFEIEAYINTCEPYDKAGGYGIQQLAGLFVKSINGSYTNVVGLPIEAVGVMLKEFGYEVTKQW